MICRLSANCGLSLLDFSARETWLSLSQTVAQPLPSSRPSPALSVNLPRTPLVRRRRRRPPISVGPLPAKVRLPKSCPPPSRPVLGCRTKRYFLQGSLFPFLPSDILSSLSPHLGRRSNPPPVLPSPPSPTLSSLRTKYNANFSSYLQLQWRRDQHPPVLPSTGTLTPLYSPGKVTECASSFSLLVSFFLPTVY